MSNQRQYRIARSASQDLNRIADYFLEHNVAAGEKFFQEFNRKCQYLIQFPYIGKRYEHLLAGARGINLNSYIIFYRVTEQTVEIFRIVHGRQNLDALFSSPD